MYMLARQLFVKCPKKEVYIFKGNRHIIIVLELTGLCVYMSNTNCNRNAILVEVRNKRLSLQRVCMRIKEAGRHDLR